MNTLFQCLEIQILLLAIFFQQYFKKVEFEITGHSKTQKYFKIVTDIQFLMFKNFKKKGLWFTVECSQKLGFFFLTNLYKVNEENISV